MKHFQIETKEFKLKFDLENYYWELHGMGAVVVRRRDNDDIAQAFASGVWQRVYNVPVAA
jgi:hypothetical protein